MWVNKFQGDLQRPRQPHDAARAVEDEARLLIAKKQKTRYDPFMRTPDIAQGPDAVPDGTPPFYAGMGRIINIIGAGSRVTL
jgi:hypothetical protein